MSARPVNLSRRALLKSGGALVVAFSIDAWPRSAQASPRASDPKVLDAWLAIHRDNTATVYLGKVELGQGNGTALLQIVAEELDLDVSRVSAAQVDTDTSMNQGATVSSSSIEAGGRQLRDAAAEARQELLRRAAERLKTPVGSLSVKNGVISGGGKSVSYGALLGDRAFEIPLTGKAPLKKPGEYRVVGTAIPRRDIPAKVAGTYQHVHHARLPGMLHGRVVRPQGQGGYGPVPKLVSVDEASIGSLPQVRIVRKGDFIGVLAAREWDAVRAAQQLRVSWDMPEVLPGNDALHQKMRGSKTTDTTMVKEGDAAKAAAAATHVAEGKYHAPYQAHAPFGPSCALADVKTDKVVVKCSSQDVFALRDRVAEVLGVPGSKVQVQYIEGSGCYGHSCYDDAAIAAALMSQAAGRPVRVQFTRADEHGWDNYGPAHVGEVRISAGVDGRLVSYQYDGWQHGWMIEETSEQMASSKPAHERSKGSGSILVNKFDAGGMYAIPNRLLVNHAVPGLEGYLKGANLRSPMDLCYSFASEQTMDELARRAGLDPVEFRRRNIADARWLGVLNAVAQASGWTAGPRSTRSDGPIAKGRGVALGTHRASMGGAVAEVEVNRGTGVVVAKRVYAALDCGCAINPGIVESQIVGMSIQGASRMLKEEVLFSKTNVTSLDWESYPILRFAEHPEVVPIVISNPANPPLGAGEEALPAVGAAIANAVFDAIGVRFTEYPITPQRVQKALRS